MRVSKLFFKTFKEAPSGADVISHQLLERAGYIRKLGRGLYTYTPLMWRVLKKVMNIVREELDKVGAQEINMPQLQPKELWEQSGRWEEFKCTDLLYTLTDREDNELCLGPTHEEAVTALVNNWLTSYKQLPVNLYQITNKFRDEIRPRFGLMRAKEFIMKDAYAFCANDESMDEQYQLMRKAYINIFRRLGLDFVIVSADSGKIGKGKSEEFQVTAEIGEDLILTCEGHASNVEATVSAPQLYPFDAELRLMQPLATPNVSSINELVALTKIPAHKMVKTVIYKLTYTDREEFVAIGIRGDRQLNEAKLMRKFSPVDMTLASDDEIKRITGTRTGFAGPINMAIKYYADNTCKGLTNFLCGGNKDDLHNIDVNWKRDCAQPEFTDLLLAEAGDGCPEVPGGVYKAQRGIEVGHIFNLGTKYSESMKALFQDENGKAQPFWMGCYGIGIGRVAAACVEQKHDDNGIIWPLSIAPYQVLITAAVLKEEPQVQAAEELYEQLSALGIEVLLDDRNERMGVKLKDSDLLGIPFKIIVGKGIADGNLEIEPRTGEKLILPRSQAAQWAKGLFNKQ